jgi:polyisoprenoid-binding protein YceI
MKIFLALLAASGVALSLESSGSEASAPPARATYEIDAGHSSVLFRCKHVGISQFYGRFNAFRGEVVYDPENPAQSSIRIEIQADSVDTNSEDRDKHLRNNDFFSAKEFPVISFVSTSVAPSDEGLAVEGELTLRGTTKPVTARAVVVGTGEAMGAYRAGFEARFRIDMRDFGISFVQKNPTALGPEVDLIVSLECLRK